MAARRKGKFVDRAFAHCPLVDRITSSFGFACVNSKTLALLEQLVDWRGVGTHYIVIVDVQAAASMSC